MTATIALSRPDWLARLRSVMVLRPGQRVVHVPGIGVSTSRRAVASGAADWWEVAGKTCVAAYQPKGAASLAASYVNLANSGTYDAAPGTAPTFDTATGWTFTAASSQYLITGVTSPAATWSMFARFANAQSGNYRSGGYLFEVYPNWFSTFLFVNGALLPIGVGTAAATTGFAGKTAYAGGSNIGTIGAGDPLTGSIYIGARNNGTAPAEFISADILALVIYSDTLTSGEVATVSAAMAAL